MAIPQTFRGGVHPREVGNGKASTASQPILTMPAPARVTIPMNQHAGAMAVPCVKAGDVVAMGQIVGTAQGVISANVHASVSGKVIAVTTCDSRDGRIVPAVVIENDHEDRWDESCKAQDLNTVTPAEIVEACVRCGITGLGGATFPTAVKLNITDPAKAPDTLVVNASECEPYLTCDDRLMVEESERVISGIRLAMKATGVKKALVGIEDNKPEAIAVMKAAAVEGIEVCVVPAKYPEGCEKMLIQVLTGRTVPNGALPSAVGCVVMNVATCASLADAVQLGHPIIDRVVTITGKVANPANVRIRIGTNLMDVIDFVGGLTEGVRKLVIGGPMMGNAVPHLNIPITRGFGGFIAMGDEAVFADETACIRCGRCIKACPMGLMPAKIDNLVRHGNYDGAIAAGAMNCMECGACTYSCPAKRQLTQSCRVAKAIARSKK